MSDLQGQPVSSLKDAPPLTPELEAAMRGNINHFYAGVPGTQSHERTMFFAEIDRLRAEVAELAQQRGDLAARVIAMTNERQSLRRIISSDSYAATFQTFGQYRTALLRAIDALDSRPTNVASDSQPSEQTR